MSIAMRGRVVASAVGIVAACGLACVPAHGQRAFVAGDGAEALGGGGAVNAAPRIPMMDVGPVEQSPPAYRYVCFKEGTDPRYASMMNEINRVYNVNAQMAGGLLGQDYQFLGGSWATTAGRPVNLRWSFVPDGTLAPGLSGPASASTLFATMDGLFPGGRAAWISRFQQCFDRWQQLTGNTYTRVTAAGVDWDDGTSFPTSAGSATRGDVRIAMRLLDGANGVLAFNYSPTNGDMVLDSGDMTAGNFLNAGNQYRFLRDVLMHEHGHGLGLAHVCPISNGMLMNPFINTSFDGPQVDDVRGVYHLYGDDIGGTGGNNTAATATAIGSISIGSTINFAPVPAPLTGAVDGRIALTALTSPNFVEWYAVTTTQPLAMTVTVTPTGGTYDNSPQNNQAASDGCSSGNVGNFTAAQDLRVTVFDSSGTTPLTAVRNATAAGSAETLSNAILSTPGSYRIRVDRASAPSAETQMYRLSVQGLSTTQCPSFVQQPTSLTPAPDVNGYCAGANVTLAVSVVGLPTPTFNWVRNGINVPNSTGLTQLTINNLQTGVNDGSYTVVANSAGAGCTLVSSNPVVLTVANPIVVTQDLQDQVVTPLDVADFVFAASGPYDTVDWIVNGNVVFTGNSTIYSFVFPPAGTYTVQASIRRAACNQPVLTRVATLTVIDPNAQPCYANCDGSTTQPVLGPADFSCFLSRFRSGEDYANCDGSTTPPVLGPADFSCFLSKFRSGC